MCEKPTLGWTRSAASATLLFNQQIVYFDFGNREAERLLSYA